MDTDNDGIMSDDSIYKTTVSDNDELMLGDNDSVLKGNGLTYPAAQVNSPSVAGGSKSGLVDEVIIDRTSKNSTWVDPNELKRKKRLIQKQKKRELKELKISEGKWLPTKPTSKNQSKTSTILKPAVLKIAGTPSTNISSPTVKRGRTSESTPPADAKKPKTMAQLVVDNNLVIIIYNDRREGGQVIESESDIIIEEIMKERTISLGAGFVPKFGGFKTIGNMLQLTCADVTSKEWLISLIEKISQKWDTLDLRCLDRTQLPKLTKAIVFIPYAPGFPSKPSDILVDLKLSNIGLKTDKWRVISTNVTNKNGITLVLGIDNESLGVIKSQNLKAFFALVQVNFNLHERASTVSEAH